MPTRVCSIEACDQPHFGRGYCRPHYRKNTPRIRSTRPIECIVCGTISHKEPSKRTYGQVCSNECRRRLTFGWSEPLPEDHWARWYGRTSAIFARPCAECAQAFVSRFSYTIRCEQCRRSPPPPARFTTGQCSECGKWFTAETYGSPVKYCSRRCIRRLDKRTRRAREHNAPGTYRYVEVMRLFIANGKRCAYCDQTLTGLPDPEHVLPLSRGGRNDLTNLVAACRSCNNDKSDLALDEWTTSRASRGLPPVNTDTSTPAFRHLVLREPSTLAFRARTRSPEPKPPPPPRRPLIERLERLGTYT